MDDGKKRIEKIRNEEIGARAGVANIRKIREAKMRWLGHVERKTEDDCSNENMEDGSG